jgi:hypothetical protein
MVTTRLIKIMGFGLLIEILILVCLSVVFGRSITAVLPILDFYFAECLGGTIVIYTIMAICCFVYKLIVKLSGAEIFLWRFLGLLVLGLFFSAFYTTVGMLILSIIQGKIITMDDDAGNLIVAICSFAVILFLNNYGNCRRSGFCSDSRLLKVESAVRTGFREKGRIKTMAEKCSVCGNSVGGLFGADRASDEQVRKAQDAGASISTPICEVCCYRAIAQQKLEVIPQQKVEAEKVEVEVAPSMNMKQKIISWLIVCGTIGVVFTRILENLFYHLSIWWFAIISGAISGALFYYIYTHKLNLEVNKNTKKSISWLIVCGTIGAVFASTLHGLDVGYQACWGIWWFISGALFYYIYTYKLNLVDSKYYEQSEQEIKDGTIDQGLWSKALVMVKGNEEKRKAEYIKLRAKQLQKMEMNSTSDDSAPPKETPPPF